ncbi:hypothetical protein ScPMuIL_015272 [Solemya velum]
MQAMLVKLFQDMNIFNELFKEVHTLERYIRLHVPDSQLDGKLVTDSDSERYKHLVYSSIVGISQNSRQLQVPARLSQNSHQKEIILRVIERIQRREGIGKNVLTFGFGVMSDDPNAQISSMPNIEYRCPNNSVSKLQYNVWKTLLSRIGDILMSHLLENTSIFLEVAETCYIQLTGVPVYDITTSKKWNETVKTGKRKHNSRKRKQNTNITSKRAAKRARLGSCSRKNAENLSQTQIDSVIQHAKKKPAEKKEIRTVRPYDYHLPIERNVFFARVMQEKLPPTFALAAKNVENGDADKLYQAIFMDPSVHSTNTTTGIVVRGPKEITPNEPPDDPLVTVVTIDDEISESKDEMNNSSLHHTSFFSSENSDESGKLVDSHAMKRRLQCVEILEAKTSTRRREGEKSVSTEQNIVSEQVPGEVKTVECEKLQTDSPDQESSCSQLEIVKKCLVVPHLPKLHSLLEKFVSNGRSCPYRGLLYHHCPLPQKPGQEAKSLAPSLVAPTFHRNSQSETSDSTALNISCDISQCRRGVRQTDKLTTAMRLESFVCYGQVFLFLRAVCLRTLPSELLGSRHNQNVFLKNVKKFIGLGRFDKICLGQLMEKMKPSDCRWLKEVTSSTGKSHLLSKLILWLIDKFVCVILKSFFYITETAAFRNRVFFYRKRNWHCLRAQAISVFLKRGMLRPITDEKVKQMVDSGSVLGISSLRFLPKSKSLRPIVNMKLESCLGQKQLAPINKQLQNLLSVLCYEKEKSPESIGFAMFGMDDIYKSWKQFVTKWRVSGCKPLYFVKVDISNCFDTIKQDKLYRIIDRIFAESNVEEYVIRKYASVVQAAARPQRRFHKHVCSLADYKPDFSSFAKEIIKTEKLHDIILVDQVMNQYETTQALLQQLRNHLINNVLKIGKRHYVQREGIPQGSVLSTILCNFYYGQMESELMNVTEEDTLMRIVDDSLFVTPDYDRAVCFLNFMLSGIPEFHCYTNPDKSLTNFEFTHKEIGNIPTIADDDYFPWCGMVFNTRTLNVSVDYSRYADLDVKDGMTFDLIHQPGNTMKRKLIYAIRHKCHFIFLDSNLNSETTVIVNSFKLLLLTAWKFHCYARHLPPHRSVEKNTFYFMEMIVDIARYFHSQATRTKKKNGEDTVFCLSSASCQWLCCKAFVMMLDRHRSQYFVLLKSLKKLGKNLNNVVPHAELESVTGGTSLDVLNSILH